MSKLAVKGHASGTGTVTLEAPNTSTNRTITLPDEDVTLTSTPEGTAVKSTGEAGGTKFLREDGDGTCSWQVAGSPSITDNGNATAIIISADEEVTMPSQPAFSVKLSSTQSNLAVGSPVTILFNSEIFDQNADFNTGTYTFTAPVTGRYQFNVNLQYTQIDSANTEYIDVWLITSNRSYRSFFDPQQQLNADADYLTLTISQLADMDASDTAYVACKQHNGTSQTDISSDNSYFSGYLVC